MRINVIQQDIDRANALRNDPNITIAKYSSAYHCPIANACNRIANRDKYWVGLFSIGNFKNERVKLPDEARAFMKAFDTNQVVQPFEFEIEKLP